MFSNALALDNEYAAAYAMAAMCVYHHKLSGVVPPTEAEIAEGVRLARIAAVKGARDAMALAWAIEECERDLQHPQFPRRRYRSGRRRVRTLREPGR